MIPAIQNRVAEWSFSSGKQYEAPFSTVELDVLVTQPDQTEVRVPAFFAGDGVWRVRYASHKVGAHRYRTICSDASNADLHGREGAIEVAPYQGANPLFRHGPLRVSQNKRHLEHADGAPFFWLGDTWWLGLCKRLSWPGDFQQLAADRAAKGFSVIQIVAGLYPDMAAFDERGANEAGFPWEKDWARINPAYFDMADLRINWLVERGLVPCILGCWGYYLPWLGVDKMKQHWRYLIARYGAYPVVWCLAGEGSMPYYLSEHKDEDRASQKTGWTELAKFVHQTDGFGRAVTIHPSDSARNTIDDPSELDIDMLQTGHGDRRSLPNTVRRVTEAYATQPPMPVVNGEVCYEGIGEACRQEVQRLMFWASMLSGASGFTYGANGIWQVNTEDVPYGASPHGMAWGHTPWRDAYQLPGSTQLGLAKRLLERYKWWQFEPHPEWVEPRWSEQDFFQPYAAGIAGQVRVAYIPWPVWGVTVKGIEPQAHYRAALINPVNGDELSLGPVKADAAGDWRIPRGRPPIYQDWLLALETDEARA